MSDDPSISLASPYPVEPAPVIYTRAQRPMLAQYRNWQQDQHRREEDPGKRSNPDSAGIRHKTHGRR